jgi:hypothetical protein
LFHGPAAKAAKLKPARLRARAAKAAKNHSAFSPPLQQQTKWRSEGGARA